MDNMYEGISADDVAKIENVKPEYAQKIIRSALIAIRDEESPVKHIQRLYEIMPEKIADDLMHNFGLSLEDLTNHAPRY